MGKVILEFDSYEESEDIQNALDGSKWKHLVWQLDQELRSVTKYGASRIDPSKEADPLEIEICEKLRETLRDYMNSWNLKID
jgi:hypothetical protein